MSRLDWRCRRGTKELDVLLQRYLQRHYSQAPAQEQRAFETLLDLQDPQLQDYLTGHLEASESNTRNVIRRILAIDARA